MTDKNKVVVGLSGGVDSASSLIFLLNRNMEVFPVTLIFCDDQKSQKAVRDSEKICSELNLQHHIIDARDLFETAVLNYFVNSYENGKTPSPCVKCNAFCKFVALFDFANRIGAHYVASGHYADVVICNGRYALKRPADTCKDQSYMLALLSQEQLSRLMFPLKNMTKSQTRQLAKDHNLHISQRKESQDLCFAEDGYIDFLQRKGVVAKSGNIIDSQGRIFGTHDGLFRYTIGQRKGIGIAAPEPYYVIAKDCEHNNLVVGFKDESLVSELFVEDFNCQLFESIDNPLSCEVKIRYRSMAQSCIARPESGGLRIILENAQSTTSPGQYAVLYQGDMLIGGGEITRTY